MLKNSLQKFVNKFDRLLILSLASVVFVSFLAILGLGIARECRKTKDAVVGYLESKIKSEQIEHSVKTRKILLETEDEVFGLSDFVFRLGSSDRLDLEEKKEFLFGLRKLEEEAVLLEDSFSAYFSDISVQYFSFSDDETASFIYESRNLGVVLERFVRQAELVLLDSSEPTKQQGELLAEQYYEVVWYVDKLVASDTSSENLENK